jgi:hypothetical protein
MQGNLKYLAFPAPGYAIVLAALPPPFLQSWAAQVIHSSRVVFINIKLLDREASPVSKKGVATRRVTPWEFSRA